MPSSTKPHFHICNRFQKQGGTYRDLLTEAILTDICRRVTGQSDFTVTFEDKINVGRLLVLTDGKSTNYVSISENLIQSRNSSFQSFPSALSRFILDSSKNKNICFFVLPDVKGNLETDYFLFMYRLMKTAGVKFLNIDRHVKADIMPFASADDVIAAKEKLRARSKGNKSTYVTKSSDGVVQVYGKTYGANKYESTLLCLALLKIAPSGIELFEVKEGGLTGLPDISKQAILAAGTAKIAASTNEIEVEHFVQNNSLRSARFIYNLLEKFGPKKCAFCDCEIAEIIQGAHIWPVSSIKKEAELDLEQQLKCALDEHNGMWLCESHHKLYDTGILTLTALGELKYLRDLKATDAEFLTKITSKRKILDCDHPTFADYLRKRNVSVQAMNYISFAV